MRSRSSELIEKCYDLGPRIPMVQHERPTCHLQRGHGGDHCDENGFKWPCAACGGSKKLVSDDGEWDCYRCSSKDGDPPQYNDVDVAALVAIAVAGQKWANDHWKHRHDLLALRNDQLTAALKNLLPHVKHTDDCGFGSNRPDCFCGALPAYRAALAVFSSEEPTKQNGSGVVSRAVD
jgi:hypothetical protein